MPSADLFDSDKYVGDVASLPHCQVSNKEDPDKSGIMITEANIEASGFDPGSSKIWVKQTTRFRSGDSTECYISQSPRMAVVRSGPLMMGTKNGEGGLDNLVPFNKTSYHGGTMSTLRGFIVFLLDEKNNLLHPSPIKLTTKSSFSYAFGTNFQKFAKALSDAYIEDVKPNNKRQRGEEFTQFGVFAFNLQPTLKGDKQKSWVCDIVDFEKPTAANWKTLFLGYDDAKRSIIEAAYEDTKDYFTYSPNQNDGGEETGFDFSSKEWEIYTGMLERATNEDQVLQARNWVEGKLGSSNFIDQEADKVFAMFAQAPVEVASVNKYDDIPF